MAFNSYSGATNGFPPISTSLPQYGGGARRLVKGFKQVKGSGTLRLPAQLKPRFSAYSKGGANDDKIPQVYPQ